MTKLYTVEIPLRLAVEANSRWEARQALLALWEECWGELPSGAGCWADDKTRDNYLREHMGVA